jgi:hypothetical protein
MKILNTITALAVSLGTAMIGHTIHHSVFWSILDFFFWPLAWIKWLILHQVTLAIIKETFSFFAS